MPPNLQLSYAEHLQQTINRMHHSILETHHLSSKIKIQEPEWIGKAHSA